MNGRDRLPVPGRTAGFAALTALSLVLAACERKQDEQTAPPRMVRTITVEAPRPARDLAFTGHVEAQEQVSLAFRIGGRLAQRAVAVGDTLREGQLVARLDPENELNELRSAQAVLAAAQGTLRKAENQLQRQTHLLARNVTTRADFEAAEQAHVAARAQVNAALARVHTAEDIVGFTELKADAPGIVTRIGAEPGEVVQAGRMIAQLARRDGRDGVFEVPADLVRSLSADTVVHVSLPGDAATTAIGHVREVSPQADPVTRTFRVRIGLSAPPPSFRLGTAVTGTVRGAETSAIGIPATALVKRGQDTGVWIVDPGTKTLSMRKLDIISSDPATVLVGKGLAVGDIVVTAGATLLKDGQIVRLSGTETR